MTFDISPQSLLQETSEPLRFCHSLMMMGRCKAMVNAKTAGKLTSRLRGELRALISDKDVGRTVFGEDMRV